MLFFLSLLPFDFPPLVHDCSFSLFLPSYFPGPGSEDDARPRLSACCSYSEERSNPLSFPSSNEEKSGFLFPNKKGSWTHELPSFPAQSAVMYFSFRGNQASSRFDHRFSAFDVSLKAFEISGQLIRLSLLDWRVLCCPGRANQPCNPIEEDHPLCILT